MAYYASAGTRLSSQTASPPRSSGSWEELELETEDAVELGDGRVFASARLRGRGKTSSAPVETRLFEIVEIRDGVITRRSGRRHEGESASRPRRVVI